jgi:hypothetical protein
VVSFLGLSLSEFTMQIMSWLGTWIIFLVFVSCLIEFSESKESTPELLKVSATSNSSALKQKLRKKAHKELYSSYSESENIVYKTTTLWGDFVNFPHQSSRTKHYIKSSFLKSIKQCPNFGSNNSTAGGQPCQEVRELPSWIIS